ncbi:hypothetical protein EC988_000001 [Linderina pennispora]|nr:hypothetical protein EC988_000001 [Linderina pennispora]
MFTGDRSKNLVFYGHVWKIFPTDNKFKAFLDSTASATGPRLGLEQVRIMRNLLTSDVIDDILDSKNIIAFKDGVIDIAHFDEGIRPGRPCDFITTQIGYAMTSAADPALEEELQELLEMIFPDESLLKYFLYHMASCLDSGNIDKLFIIWHGLGNNGKSVMESLVEHAFGSYCYKAPTSLFSSRRADSSGATPELVRLNKSLVSFVQESDNREQINVGILKELTGNDTIYTRGLYEAPRTIEVRCKFILVTNKVYNLSQADDATWARIRVIPFLSKFVRKESEVSKKKRTFLVNPHYIKRVRSLAPYFMRLLMEYYPRYREEGMPECELVDEHTNSLKRLNSPVALFVEDELYSDETGSVMFQEVYDLYRTYARKNCGIRTTTAADFDSGMRKLGVSIVDGYVIGYYIR